MIRVLRKISNQFFHKRMNAIHAFVDNGEQIQKETLLRLVEEAKQTEIGNRYNFQSIFSCEDFQESLPIVSYEDVEKDIARMKDGEENILWPTSIEFFAKSSGTTGSVSKYIPVSYEFLQDCHYQGGKDMLSLYFNQFPESRILFGKTLALGGSLQEDSDTGIMNGDVSAVLISNLPVWARLLKTPSQEIALLSDWEEKSNKIVETIIHEDLIALAGAPAWVLAIIKKAKEVSGVSNLSELWPNLEVFFYGGTSIKPFEKEYKELLGESVVYMGIYNASEGFFGIQDDVSRDGELMLMLDYDVVYEFLPFPCKEGDVPVFVDGIQEGKTYELILTTSSGLWRYRIGDVVTVTSLKPLRVKIAGRTKQYINVFGEEVMVHNVEDALREACKKTGAVVSEFTVGPIFQTKDVKGGHEWLVEFTTKPSSLDGFAKILDQELRECNSDYNAKRNEKMEILQPLVLRCMPQDTFVSWMKSRNKLGGQHKVPRLSNDRQYIDDILERYKSSEV